MKIVRRHRSLASAVQALEARTLFAVFLDSSIADVSVRPGNTSTTTIPLASRFRTTNLNGVTGTLVRMPVAFGSGSARVESSINLQLFDTSTPLTVQNFLNYVSANRYDNSIIHRSTTLSTANLGVVQGGGFTFASNLFDVITANPSVVNEFSSSPRDSNNRVNVRGTIAMAKVGTELDSNGQVKPGTGPNSATSQWFINTTDNTALDNVNNSGGFTTFGRVIGGLNVADQINALTIYNAETITPAFGELPLASYSSGAIKAENVVTFSDAAVVATPTTYFDYKVTSSDSKVAAASIDASGNLKLTYPAKAKLGITTVTLTATDLTGASVSDTFTITVANPALTVTYNGLKVTSSTTAVTDLGTAFTGQSATRTFKLQNTGKGILDLGTLTLPDGLTAAAPLPDTLAAGASFDLVLNVDTSAPTVRTGNILIASDASDTAFSIPVRLEVGSGVNLGGTGTTAVKSVIYTDADGTKATFAFKGAGTARLEFGGTGLSALTVKGVTTVTGTAVTLTNLTLSSTTPTTTLTSTVKGGNSAIAVSSVSSNSSLKQLSLRGVVVSDTLTLPLTVSDLLVAGLDSAVVSVGTQSPAARSTTYAFGNVTDSIVTLAGSVKTVTLAALSGGTLSLTGGSFTALNLALAANTSITAAVPLSTVKVTGSVTNTTFSAALTLTRFAAASLTNSTVRVGVQNGVTTPAAAGDFTGTSELKALNLTSKTPGAFAGSGIFAAVLGKIAVGTLSDAAGQSLIRGTTLAQLSGKNTGNKAFSVKKVTASTDIDAQLTALGVPNARLDVTLF